MKKAYIVTPVFNDWKSLKILLMELDKVAKESNYEFRVIAVNDGSSEPYPLFSLASDRVSIDVVTLTHNQGHQRAICVGLVSLYDFDPAPTIVMDCDGEDQPQDIPCLLETLENTDTDVVFANRSKRTESSRFIIAWYAFRLLFRFSVGTPMRSGNFSVLSHSALRRIITAPSLWNHYAASIQKLRMRVNFVEIDRGNRYEGRSKMNLVGLVTHGLSAIAVYSEIVATRMLLILSTLAFSALIILGLVITVRLSTDLAIPGWATYTAGLVIIFVTQLLTLSAVVNLLVLSQRSNRQFNPLRDVQDYVSNIEINVE